MLMYSSICSQIHFHAEPHWLGKYSPRSSFATVSPCVLVLDEGKSSSRPTEEQSTGKIKEERLHGMNDGGRSVVRSSGFPIAIRAKEWWPR